MENRIRELFGVVLKVPSSDIDDDTRPATLERWDSLQHLILVSSFEEEFDIEIDPEEIVEMYENFRRFRDIVMSKLEGAA